MRYFYYVCWFVEVLVGLGLFTISFLLQNEVLQSFMSSAVLALLLAVVFEAAKVAAIVWHRYFISLDLAAYPDSIRITSFSFRLGLLVLSMLCSVIYLSSHLDRPYLKQVQSEEIGRQESFARQRIEALRTEQELRRADLLARQKAELDAKRTSSQQRTLLLEQNLKDEMDNVVNGVFQGPRYQEINKLLDQAYARDLQETAELKSQQFREQQELNRILSQQKQSLENEIRQQAAADRQAILTSDFANDARVNHPMVQAFLKVAESVFEWRLKPLQFVCMFSVLTSVLIELGILLSFDTVTLSIHSLMVKQQTCEIDKEILKADVHARKTEDEIKHEADIDMIKKTAVRTADKAKVYWDETELY